MKKAKYLAFIAALVCLPALAQDVPYLLVHFDEIDPSKTAEFEANAKAWVAAFTEAGMDRSWTWLTYSSGFTYSWVGPLPSYAMLDALEERQKLVAEKLGAEKMQSLMEGTRYVVSHKLEVLKALPELSYVPEQTVVTRPTFTFVGIHHVKPAMSQQFESVIKRLVAAYKQAKAPIGFNAFRTELGELVYRFVVSTNDAKQFYSQPEAIEVLGKTLGEEETMKILAEWRDCITAYEVKQWMFRPDLSYEPAPEAKPAE